MITCRTVILFCLILLTTPALLEAQLNLDKSANLFPIKQNDKYGYKNTSGEIVIKPRFNEACKFSEGLACVKIKSKWGYINKNGKIVIEPQFDKAESFSNGRARVMKFKMEAYHTFGSPGEPVLSGGYKEVEKWYLIDQAGKSNRCVVPDEVKSASGHHEEIPFVGTWICESDDDEILFFSTSIFYHRFSYGGTREIFWNILSYDGGAGHITIESYKTLQNGIEEPREKGKRYLTYKVENKVLRKNMDREKFVESLGSTKYKKCE